MAEKIKDILSPGKNHETSIDSEIKPALTHERIHPTQQQEIVRETLQEHDIHHHQHRIQPVHDTQTLDTQHRHETLATEHRHIENKMSEADAGRFQQHQQGLKDERQVMDTQTTVVEGDAKVATKVHHHIHETIQPVIQRETYAPTVIHTTKAVHEHITDRPIVHDQTIEPAMSLEEFASRAKNIGSGPHHSEHPGMKPNVVPTKDSQTS